MARNILGIIVGYIAMAVFLFICFTVLYLILGTEGSFEPGSYMVSSTWIVISIIIGLIAAIIGGYVCMLISKNLKAAYILAAIVLVLGIILAVPAMNVTDEELNKPRLGDVPNMEAMQSAKQPPLILILNPIIGAIGVVIGSKMKRESTKPKEQIA